MHGKVLSHEPEVTSRAIDDETWAAIKQALHEEGHLAEGMAHASEHEPDLLPALTKKLDETRAQRQELVKAACKGIRAEYWCAVKHSLLKEGHLEETLANAARHYPDKVPDIAAQLQAAIKDRQDMIKLTCTECDGGICMKDIGNPGLPLKDWASEFMAEGKITKSAFNDFTAEKDLTDIAKTHLEDYLWSEHKVDFSGNPGQKSGNPGDIGVLESYYKTELDRMHGMTQEIVDELAIIKNNIKAGATYPLHGFYLHALMALRKARTEADELVQALWKAKQIKTTSNPGNPKRKPKKKGNPGHGSPQCPPDMDATDGFCSERVEAPSAFNKRYLRTVKQDGHRVTVGCPKGKYNAKKKKCKVATEAQRILHPKKEFKEKPAGCARCSADFAG